MYMCGTDHLPYSSVMTFLPTEPQSTVSLQTGTLGLLHLHPYGPWSKVVHYYPYGPWSKVVHYVWNRVHLGCRLGLNVLTVQFQLYVVEWKTKKRILFTLTGEERGAEISGECVI